jgi:hypothetical protein
MKSKTLLRAASIVMLIHAIGHTFGHLSWKEVSEPTKQEVINQMTQKQFPFMGTVRSMGDYYTGYGYASTIALLLVVFLLWIISGTLEKTNDLSKKVLIGLTIFLFCWGIDEIIYFFPFAAGFSFLSFLLCLIVLIKLK